MDRNSGIFTKSSNVWSKMYSYYVIDTVCKLLVYKNECKEGENKVLHPSSVHKTPCVTRSITL